MPSESFRNFFRKPIFSNYKLIFSVFFIATLVTAIQNTIGENNNYKIFYYSLKHLQQGISLYNEYPAEYTDHYRYAPSFAVIFLPFFILPFKLGIFLWHFFFGLMWMLAIYKMPFTKGQKVFAYWYGLEEYLTSLSNAQTNPSIAAIPLFAFLCFEKKQPFWAAFFILLGFHIKIYSLVAAALFIIYPQKLKFILSSIFWAIALALFPLVVTSPDKLLWQYELWVNQLIFKTGVDKFANTSIHRIVHQVFSPDITNVAIIAAGVILFCTVYIYRRLFNQENFKMLLLASILIFQVIFQPAAESPTYIIAVTGVIIYWFYCPKTNFDLLLIILCFILTVMSPTDFMPKYLREQFIRPYVLKAWPCVLIWFRILYLTHYRGINHNKSMRQEPTLSTN